MKYSLMDALEKGFSPQEVCSIESIFDECKGGYSSYKGFIAAFLEKAKNENKKFVRRYLYVKWQAIKYFSSSELKALDDAFNKRCEEIAPRKCTDDCSECHLVSCGIVNGSSNEIYEFNVSFSEYEFRFYNLAKTEFEKIGSPFEERIKGFYNFVK